VEVRDPALLWRELMSFGWILWLGLFLPALVAFEAIALAGMEHSGKHWKQLLALPIPRWRVFAVKMLICGVLVGASFVVFLLTTVGGVLLFGWARGLHLAGALPVADVLVTAAKAYAACWLLIVTHLWISVRYPGFAVPAGVGFAAMLMGFMAMNVGPEYFSWWYPWTLPINVRPDGLYHARSTVAPALAGLLGGLALAPLASWDLGRRTDEI
jgi:ABC-2 type transport system permease protein